MAIWAGDAPAAPGAADKVYGPSVRQGVFEIELRNSFFTGGAEDGASKHLGEISYGVTDWWQPAVLLEIEHDPGGAYVVEAIEFENIFELPHIPGSPIQFGLYAEYEASLDGVPDELKLRALAGGNLGPVQTRLNFTSERKFGGGAPDVWEFTYGASAMVEVYDAGLEIMLGAEAFGDLGTTEDFGDLGSREHYVGPAVAFAVESPRGEIELQAGYLFGVGMADADGQVRLMIEYETHF